MRTEFLPWGTLSELWPGLVCGSGVRLGKPSHQTFLGGQADQGPPGWLCTSRSAQHRALHPPADRARGTQAPLLLLQTPSLARRDLPGPLPDTTGCHLAGAKGRRQGQASSSLRPNGLSSVISFASQEEGGCRGAWGLASGHQAASGSQVSPTQRPHSIHTAARRGGSTPALQPPGDLLG